MALRLSHTVQAVQLTNILKDHSKKVKLIDCRSFLEFNDNHIIGAVNICCSKLIKRRLQQDKILIKDLLAHCRIEIDDTSDVIIYDQRTASVDDIAVDSFIHVLLKKLTLIFSKVSILSGGFVEFYGVYPELCENMIWRYPGLTALSQPCLPTTSSGPTRILPFLYLGSEDDANNKELLQSHNITYELNVSNKCVKPDFINDAHFMRIPVNDSHNEKLLPYFAQTFQFVEKVRESHECALIHCLAGISRSPTVAIAYVMRHLMMSCEDAYRYVKAKRATISPNFNFLGQLLEYEQMLGISEKITENKVPFQPAPVSTSQSLASDFFLGPQTLLSPTTTCLPSKSIGKRLNLSLGLLVPTSLGSPKDSSPSPTTAMSRLQFDKPLGKENRTGSATTSSGAGGSTSACNNSLSAKSCLSLGGLSFSIPRPTRLVKEQNVTSIKEEEIGVWESVTTSMTRQSVSTSISKGFSKSRKSSLDQFQQQMSEQASTMSMSSSGGGVKVEGSLPSSSTSLSVIDEGGSFGNVKKCRVHKFVVEEEQKKSNEKEDNFNCEGAAIVVLPSEMVDSSSSSSSSRRVSVSNESNCSSVPVQPSGSGVLYSPRDYLRSDSVSTSGIGSEISDHSDHDLLASSGSWDMTESGSVHDDGVFSDNYSLYSKSPKASRQLQLWSSDSGHWSSADEGVYSSCSSSTTEVPPVVASSSTIESKSPEKRKCTEYLFPSSSSSSQRANAANLEKRRSYADGCSNEWFPGDSSSRPKRWSLAEDTIESPCQSKTTSGPGRWEEDLETETKNIEDNTSRTSSSSGSHLNFGQHWFNLLSGWELTCCERQEGGDGLYRRTKSCPGICGHRDWPQSHNNQVPDSPSEPISDSALLKMRSCRNRRKNGAAYHPGHPGRFSCVDYDELWGKLQKVQDSKSNETQSSSSTLASSSYSIVVQ